MAKKLLMGNEAFAHAALEAGVNVVAGYPGTPSSEVIETIARLHKSGKAEGVYVEWSTNEKAALEVAAAAAISGARALFTCKQVGLNVASDALMSLNYVGVRGGLVIFVTDDPGPISSQTEQDTRRFAAFAKVPVLDPATPEQGAQMIKEAFRLSEEYKTPVIIRPTTRIDHASTFFDVQPRTVARPVPAGAFKRNPEEWVIFPKRSYRAHGEINKRLQSIAHEFTYDARYAQFNEGFEKLSNGMARPLPSLSSDLERPSSAGRIDDDPVDSEQMGLGDPQILKAFTGSNTPSLGIVAGGVSTQYALEALQLIEEAADRAGVEVPSYRFMQVGTPYPFPRRLVSRFLKDLSDVIVFEELDSVIEEELLKAAGMSFLSPNIHGKLTDETNTRGENSTEDCAQHIAYFFDKYSKSQRDKTEVGYMTLTALVEHAIGPNALLSYPGKLPMRAPVLCAGCPHRGSFYAMKKAVSKLKIQREDAVFCGDIGCYTLGNANPLDAVDTCLCMGAGITMAQGFAQTNPEKKNIAFVGDSTFFASGMTGVANAVYNQHDITLCVLDNSTTAMTGSQPHPGTGATLMGPKSQPLDIAKVLEALGVNHITHVNPLDVEASEAACIEALEVSEPSAVIFQSPCVWLEPFSNPARVHINLCTGCKRCITEIGCPAIGFDMDAKGAKSGHRGQAVIDLSQCNGCGLCLQVCPFSAIDIITPEERELMESAARATDSSKEPAPGSVGSANSRNPRQQRQRRADGTQSDRQRNRRRNAGIGDDVNPAENASEPNEAQAIAAELLEENFASSPSASSGNETGFTSVNIYGDRDVAQLLDQASRNAAGSNGAGTVNISSRVANLGKGLTGSIGLDSIGSDFDGFVDRLVNGIAANAAYSQGAGSSGAPVQGRYGRDAYRPDSAAGQQMQSTEDAAGYAGSQQGTGRTYHYSMKDVSYRQAFTVSVPVAEDNAYGKDAKDSNASDVSGSFYEAVEPANREDEKTSSGSKESDSQEDALDVLAALNSGVFIDMDDSAEDHSQEESSSGSGRSDSGKKSSQSKAASRNGNSHNNPRAKSGSGTKDNDSASQSNSAKQSRWGGRG